MGRIDEQVAAVADGECTAVEAAEAAIARIEAGDGDLNAVVVRDFDRALAAAAEVDHRRAAGERPPLLGLPMTVKEAFDVAGLPTTWGLEASRDHVATADAVAVRRLKEAGAVILGKTNVPPALSDHQSSNPIYGATHNPHGRGRSPGGSSGGSAASVASGFVAAEIGTDIGGSIRIPASFCGVWGLKPTFDLVSKEGHFFPGMEAHGDELSVAGPIAGSAQDLDRLLGVLAEHPLPDLDDRAPADLRVAVLVDQAEVPVSAAVRAEVEAVALRFESAGATVDRAPDVPSLAEMRDVYSPILSTIIAGGLPYPGQEPMTVRAWFDLLDAQARVRRQWSAVLQHRYDVVLSPVYSTPAFPIDELDIITRMIDIDGDVVPIVGQLIWAGLAILTGMPSVAFPSGLSADGLPIGLQLMGAHHRDRDLLRLADLVAGPAALLA
jgi:amidase